MLTRTDKREKIASKKLTQTFVLDLAFKWPGGRKNLNFDAIKKLSLCSCDKYFPRCNFQQVTHIPELGQWLSCFAMRPKSYNKSRHQLFSQKWSPWGLLIWTSEPTCRHTRGLETSHKHLKKFLAFLRLSTYSRGLKKRSAGIYFMGNCGGKSGSNTSNIIIHLQVVTNQIQYA